MADARDTAQAVLDRVGTTVARQAGIAVADAPAPLWQTLVAANLVSARISASIAVAAARELIAAGGGTAAGMAELSWQQRVDALGRGHYVRYDESTATRLGDCAHLALDSFGGDLRRMDAAARRDRRALERELQRFPGIGPTGAAVFCREAQQAWAWLRPYADKAALRGAAEVGLPQDPAELARLVDGEDLACFFGGLVRLARDTDALRELRGTR